MGVGEEGDEVSGSSGGGARMGGENWMEIG